MNPVYGIAILVGLGMWTGLARAAIGSPVYAAVLDAIAVGLLATAAWSARRRTAAIRPGIIDLLVVVFVAIAAIEIFNPNVPSVSVGLEGFRKTAFMAIGYAVARLAPSIDRERFLRLVVLAAIPAVIWSIRQFFTPIPLELSIISTSGTSSTSFHSGTVLRAFAPTASPFHLGILSGTFAIASTLLADRRGGRWLVPAILVAAALGLSLTRANILATVFALATLAGISLWRERRIRLAGIAGLVSAIALVVALFAASSKPPYSPPGSGASTPQPASSQAADASVAATQVPATPPPIRIPDPTEDRSLLFRVQFWREQLAAVADRPLIGYGTSAAADGFGRLYAGTGSRNFEPHSIYLKILLEQGIVGFVVFVGLLGALLVEAVQRLRRRDSSDIFGLSALGVLLLVTISGLTGPMLDAYPFNLLFWTIAGLLVRSSRCDTAPA